MLPHPQQMLHKKGCVVQDNAPNNLRSGVTNILSYLQTIWLLKCRIGNRRVEGLTCRMKVDPCYSLPLCSTSKVFRIVPLSPVKRHSSRYKMIHIYISRLGKSNIILKHKHLPIYNTWNTYGRSNLFIINNGKSLGYNPMSETRTPLSPKDSKFLCSKDFCRQSTSITFLSKYVSPTPSPRPLFIWMKWGSSRR